MHEVRDGARCQGADRRHRARDDDHAIRRVRARGDRRADVRVRDGVNLRDGLAGERARQFVAGARDVELFEEDAAARGRDDEVDVRDLGAAVEVVQQALGVDRAGGARDGDGDALHG